jgi:hypothetical protein
MTMVESLLTPLVTLVRAHYAKPDPHPLYLSRVGQDLGNMRKELVTKYGGLAEAIAAAGQDVLDIVGRDQPGRETVVTPEVREAVSAKLFNSASVGGTAFDKLPAPLRIAFCLRLQPGQKVAVRTTAPVKYVRLEEDEPLPDGFVLIQEKYRQPGLHLASASIADKIHLWRVFSNWAEEHHVYQDLLSKRPAPANALERLLAAQRPDILPCMNLPADIVDILLRHS